MTPFASRFAAPIRNALARVFTGTRPVTASEPAVPAPTASPAPIGTPERWTVIAGFIVFAIFQMHAATNHGSWGQDFGTHLAWIKDAFDSPRTFATTYQEKRTNPPLYHLMASLVIRLVGPKWDPYTLHQGLILLALFSAALHALAMVGFYHVLRRVIRSAPLRVACMLFLLFLPFAMIHSLVIAADALVTPLFLFAVYLFARLTDPLSPGQFARIAIGLCVVMTASAATKFTSMSLVPAAALVLIALWRVGALSRVRLAVAAALVVAIPGTFAYWQFGEYKRQQTYTLGISKEMKRFEGGFTLKNLVWVKRADIDYVKAAPAYDALAEDGKTLAITIPNRNSYLAMLHVAMFSDILNIYQFDPTDGYFGPRTPKNAMRMRRAVRTAVPFTIGAVLAVPVLLVCGFVGVWRRDPRWAVVTILPVLGGAFFLLIVAFLPYVAAFGGGYWLPRLIAPSLLCFFALLFIGLDRLFGRWRGVAWACLAFVIVQSVFHLTFLWPTPTGA